MNTDEWYYTLIPLPSTSGAIDVPAGTRVLIRQVFPAGHRLSDGSSFTEDTYECRVFGVGTRIRTQEQHLSLEPPPHSQYGRSHDAVGVASS